MNHSLNSVNERNRAKRAAEEAAIEAAIAEGKKTELIYADKKVVEKAARLGKHVDAYYDDGKSKDRVDNANAVKRKVKGNGISFQPLNPISKWEK